MLGVLEGSGETGSVIVMDLAVAQRELGRLGRVDRIHLKVPDEPSLAEWQRRLQAALPSGRRVAPGRQPDGRESPHARRVSAEPARAELHRAAGGRIPDLQHDFGVGGATAARKSASCAPWARRAARCWRRFLAKRRLWAWPAAFSGVCWEGLWPSARCAWWRRRCNRCTSPAGPRRWSCRFRRGFWRWASAPEWPLRRRWRRRARRRWFRRWRRWLAAQGNWPRAAMYGATCAWRWCLRR